MTDNVQRIARQIAEANTAGARRLDAERSRARSGVVEGGPYGTFFVNKEGLITWAGGSTGMLCISEGPGTQEFEFDGVETLIFGINELADPGPDGHIDTSSGWEYIAGTDTEGLYLVHVMCRIDVANWSDTAEATLTLHVGGYDQDVDYVTGLSANTAAVHLDGWLANTCFSGQSVWAEVSIDTGSGGPHFAGNQMPRIVILRFPFADYTS